MKVYSIIVAGGKQFKGFSRGIKQSSNASMEVIFGDSKTKKLPNWPDPLSGVSCSMIKHDDSILMSRGENFKAFLKLDQLENGSWKEYKTINKKRSFQTAVSTETATFVFGGIRSPKTYEYLPKDTTKWLPGLTEIPGGFDDGYAIAVKSEQEILLIGGYTTEERILSFDVNKHTFEELPIKLNIGRHGHRCENIPYTNKIIVTGGKILDNTGNLAYTNSTEIIDIENGSVSMASPMNSERSEHGIGILTIDDENVVAVFGGYDGDYSLRSVELYNGYWETTKMKLSEGKRGFGFLSVRLGALRDDCTSSNSYTQLCQKHKNAYVKRLDELGVPIGW